MRLAIPHLSRKTSDPYWESFIEKSPADMNNLIAPAIRAAADGQVFPVKSDTHTPEVMTEQIKELGRFFGANLMGVTRTGGESDLPFVIVCGIRSEYDPSVSKGIGGQAATLTGAYVTFNLAAAIRELGYQATRSEETALDDLAARAGLGTLDSSGRLVTRNFGRKIYVADAILTDLPLRPDSPEA